VPAFSPRVSDSLIQASGAKL